MRCARVQEQLTLYLAEELSPGDSARFKDHLTHCAACTAAAEDLGATQERISAVLRADIEPPATLDTRVMTAIRALPVQNRSWQFLLPGWQPRYAFAAALCLLALLGVAIGVYHWAEPALELAAFGEAHSRLNAASTPPELPGSDVRQITGQLAPQVPFPIRAADLKSDGALLAGGRRILVDNVAVVALHYTWEGHPITLFEMDSAQRTPSQLRQLERAPDSYYVHKVGDLAYVAWHSGRTDCVMVARAVPMHQLFHLACHACERQEQTQVTAEIRFEKNEIPRERCASAKIEVKDERKIADREILGYV